jgi:ferric-dicitrate binding protein FerR (iron transport regulator)
MLGDVSEEEKVQIMTWIDEDSHHVEQLKSLGIIYDAAIWNQDKNASCRKSSSSSRTRKLFVNIGKVAAIFAFGFFMSALIQFVTQKPDRMQCLYVPAGQRAELTLGDGTHVWLNSNSKIIYPSSFEQSHRDISLEGEAYFKVSHDKHRPFNVNAAGYKIQVLGTEFNVQAYDKNKYEVDLLKGSVHIITPDNQVADLKPGDRAFLRNRQVVKGTIVHPEHFQWREGLLSFSEETMGDIFKKIELFYGVRIVCHNDNLVGNHYSGKFRIRDGVEHIMKVLQIDNHFDYAISADRSTVIVK